MKDYAKSTAPATTTIKKTVTTHRPVHEVFAFFDRPQNLKQAAPTEIAVSMLRHPADLRPGSVFGYRLQRWPVDVSWEIVVSEYKPPRGFTGVKSTGYFPRWALRHEFTEAGDQTELTLALDYEVPPGLRAAFSNAYVIREAMEEMLARYAEAFAEALDRRES